ncbi:nucleotidyltransferase family protein [Lysinibacillus sphaericus]|uniref:nucleotidyltransferase family protein n=1 Tax=Lysinibacillus sphaericus TaxID=1421 RepID=UPI003D7F5314
MKQWRKILVHPHYTLLETMKIIDESSLQIAVVVDESRKLLGIVTDGDVRRGILKGNDLNVPISKVMNSNPITGNDKESKNHCYRLMRSKKLRQLPIVNEKNILVDILFRDHQLEKENTIVLMVGGLGTRLRPLTNHIPKPMLKVGGKPILETIIEGFKQYGYTNFVLSVNYKKEIIQNYFQNGDAFGVSITYIEENKRMGTAGALSLLPVKPKKPIFVMNGDLLTQVNFEQLMQFHIEQNSVATMCVREYEYQIPYGVIEINGPELVAIQEKPIQKSFVNAGIYVLNPEVLEYIPKDEYFDMPLLFEKIIMNNNKTSVFPLREYWLDIGQMDDFEKANIEYEEFYK